MKTAAPEVLRLRKLGKHYGKTVVLKGVDLSVAQGESLAIIGPNGAGKSTLFNLISGRSAPSEGEIWLKGKRIDGLAAHRINRLGLSRSFQVSHGFARLSVFDNLRCAALWSQGQRYVFWRPLSGMRAVAVQAGEMMERIGLLGRAQVLAGELSYAEQRALEIGITVIGLADRIAVLAQGEILCVDTPAAVRANARVQQAYLGALDPAPAIGASGGSTC